jgi:hypothetical protein
MDFWEKVVARNPADGRADWIRTSDLLNPKNKRTFLAKFGEGWYNPGQVGILSVRPLFKRACGR